MNEHQRHNFRLLRSRLRGLSKAERADTSFIVRNGLFGPVLLLIRDAARAQASA